MTLPARLLRTEDLARLLGKSPEAVRVQRHRDPELLPPAIKIGNRVYFDPRDVEAWIADSREPRGCADSKPGATFRQIRLAAVKKRAADGQ
jgi:predicted DNA-binding transcriptional regulator AlpA